MNMLNGSRFGLLPVGEFANEMNRWTMDRKNSDFLNHCPTTIFEDDTHYHFEFDLPGFQIENIDLKVTENELELKACREFNHESAPILQERSPVSVHRNFSIPMKVDGEAVEASYVNGVLSVSIAKAAESQMKRIEISTS